MLITVFFLDSKVMDAFCLHYTFLLFYDKCELQNHERSKY